jgi:hypothetical protein
MLFTGMHFTIPQIAFALWLPQPQDKSGFPSAYFFFFFFFFVCLILCLILGLEVKQGSDF